MGGAYAISGERGRRVDSLHALAAAVEAAAPSAYELSTINAPVERDGEVYRTDLVIDRKRVAGLTLDPRTGRFEISGLGWWREPGKVQACLEGCGLDRGLAEEVRVAINRAFHAAEADYGRDIPFGTLVTRV